LASIGIAARFNDAEQVVERILLHRFNLPAGRPARNGYGLT